MNDPVSGEAREIQNHRELRLAAMASFPPRPEAEEERGVVICGGGERYLPCAWVLLNELRLLGCTLPAELWHLGEAEMPRRWRGAFESFPGLRLVDALEVRERHPARTLNGWELKPYSILHCRFREVLLLDADNVPVADPGYLFEGEEYQRTGAVFWPDYWSRSPEQKIWEICDLEFRDDREFETGQILVNKERRWRELCLTMHLNEHSDFYYRHVHGDKETFYLAWRMLGTPWAMPGRGIHGLEGTMCQHDMEGRRVFQHRNLRKWTLPADGNEPVEGFINEERCLGHLARLPDLFRRAGACPDAACGSYLYERVGHDVRPMTLLPGGVVGEGAAARELGWEIRGETLFLTGEQGDTAALDPAGGGAWSGRWLVFEKMPALLIPVPEGRARALQEAMERLKPYLPLLGPRAGTMEEALRLLASSGGPVTVVELGVTRSFIGGAPPGTDFADPALWRPENPEAWDWGAGSFTRVAAETLAGCGLRYHGVDPSPSSIAVSLSMLGPLFEGGENGAGALPRSRVRTHRETAESFLNSFGGGADLIYFDHGDCGEETAAAHERDARTVLERGLVKPGGLVLIDDHRHDPALGLVPKSLLSQRLFKEAGWETVREGLQLLLRRPPEDSGLENGAGPAAVRLGVVIPTVNRADLLKECLESLAGRTRRPAERVLVIDNGRQGLEEKGIPAVAEGVEILETERNLGVAASWNLGLRELFKDPAVTHVMALNDDITLGPGQTEALRAALAARPGTWMFTGPFEWAAWVLSRAGFKAMRDPLTGQCFDEGFHPAYFEDNDFHHRIAHLFPGRYLGGVAELAPAVARRSMSIEKDPSLNARFEANRSYYAGKWGGPPGHEELVPPGPAGESAAEALERLYRAKCEIPSDISGHLPTLRRHASGCALVTEFGVRSIVSTWALLAARPRVMTSCDLHRPAGIEYALALAREAGTDFRFEERDVTEPGFLIDETDLLFIDTLHTFRQLSRELAVHGNRARRFIILHDTVTFGHRDEDDPGGPGLVPAVDAFLKQNPHWRRLEEHTHDNGLTVLARAADSV